VTITWASPSPAATILSVPFNSQFGSSYTDGTLQHLDFNYGGNNCGPTSLSMVIDYFVAKGQTTSGTKTISALDAANYIRGGSAYNYRGYNAGTNFGLDNSSTGTRSRSLLGLYGLHLNAVHSLSDVYAQISAGHPVVMLVNNNAYAGEQPYGSSPGSGMWTTSHIIVVTGFDSGHVYINDPLRAPGSASSFSITTAEFTTAATTTGQSVWYGAGVSP
jgi:uncharacterized protein YvpB